jgi:hypothetical protein
VEEGKMAHDTKFDIPRKRLREMGIPEDMTAEDVIALFSLPDDDDSMHAQTGAPPPRVPV